MINWYYVGKSDYYGPDGPDLKSPIPIYEDLNDQWWLWYQGWLSEHLMGYWCHQCGKAAIDCNGEYKCGQF